MEGGERREGQRKEEKEGGGGGANGRDMERESERKRGESKWQKRIR